MVQFRIDDIGASTKHFNQHGKKKFYFKSIPFFYFPMAHFWFFKRIWPFKKWAVYDELTVEEWKPILDLFKKNSIQPIIAITACWVEADNSLNPFYVKFPQEAKLLKQALKDGIIRIANHGLTHCVVGKHLPIFWGSNRRYHREFWPWLPQSLHTSHIKKSQQILENFFEEEIEIFVPPGNVWSEKTYQAFKGTNINKVISKKYKLDSKTPMNEKGNVVQFIDDNKGYFNFHDRELKLFGISWLNKKINIYT